MVTDKIICSVTSDIGNLIICPKNENDGSRWV